MKTGEVLKNELETLSENNQEFISDVRGRGTMLAFDCVDGATRDKLVTVLRHKGVNAGGCGDRTFRLRPSLFFGPEHVSMFMDRLHSSIKDLK